MKNFYELKKNLIHIAAGYKRVIKKIQDNLQAAGAEQSDTVLVLDGRPNNVLDKDPGKISGDCTSGFPLPFANPNIPVFNIKVGLAGRHVGNMYLLETSMMEDDQPVWHLDAIQIPSQRVDWSSATIRKLVMALAQEQRKRESNI